MDQDGDVEQRQDCDFRHQAEAEQAGAEADLAPAAQHDDANRGNSIHPPRQCDAERQQCLPQEDSEGGIGRDLDRVVGQERDERPADTGRLPDTVGYVGVEGTGAADMPAHRGEADAEDHIDEADQDERPGHTGAVAERERRRCCADDGGQRRRRRNHEEDDM